MRPKSYPLLCRFIPARVQTIKNINNCCKEIIGTEKSSGNFVVCLERDIHLNLDQAYRRGSIVRYEPPYLYYEETNSSTSRGTNEDEREGFDFESTYSEEHLQNANHFIETLQNPSVEIQSQNASGRHQQAMLTSERNKEYVKITNAYNHFGYGGNQAYFKDGYRMRRYHLHPSQLVSHGCGPTALSDNIAYHALYKGQTGLLKYTDEQKITSPGGPNIKYKKENFNKKFVQDGRGFTQQEYTKFMDFYAEMVGYPGNLGWSNLNMNDSFRNLSYYTDYKATKSQPKSYNVSDAEQFIFDSLNSDTPVFMLNTMETAETRYLLNDPEQKENLGFLEGVQPDFDYHWMTITKIFKDGKTGTTSVAFATWGYRVSINTDLLKQNGKYYSTLSSYTITPK